MFLWNALKRTWQPATLLKRPHPTDRPRTYTVNIKGKIYQRTRDHLRPRSQSEITPSAGNTFPPVGPVASVHDPENTHSQQQNRTTRLDSTPPPEQSTSKLPCSERQVGLQPTSTFTAGKRTYFQPKSQVTRTGHVIGISARFKD